MSDIMLHGVLNMPPECWSGSPIDLIQRHSRYVQASKYINELNVEIDRWKELHKAVCADRVEVMNQRDLAREDRDTLAEALKVIKGYPSSNEFIYLTATEALKSLT